MGVEFWIPAALVIFAAAAVAIWRIRVRPARREAAVAQARVDFQRRREHLEAKFLHLAANSGKPRGLEWVHCEFDNGVAFARERTSDDLAAFVGVTISFEAIPGGGMEEVEAVGNLRAATAVFRYRDGRWETDGRTIFNLNPTEAIHRFGSQLEPLAEA